jgi:nucleoid-associated protein YgaU
MTTLDGYDRDTLDYLRAISQVGESLLNRVRESLERGQGLAEQVVTLTAEVEALKARIEADKPAPRALSTCEEARARGEQHGADAANYDLAYGTDEKPLAQGSRRGKEYFPNRGQESLRVQYALGFTTAYRKFVRENQEG